MRGPRFDGARLASVLTGLRPQASIADLIGATGFRARTIYKAIDEAIRSGDVEEKDNPDPAVGTFYSLTPLGACRRDVMLTEDGARWISIYADANEMALARAEIDAEAADGDGFLWDRPDHRVGQPLQRLIEYEEWERLARKARDERRQAPGGAAYPDYLEYHPLFNPKHPYRYFIGSNVPWPIAIPGEDGRPVVHAALTPDVCPLHGRVVLEPFEYCLGCDGRGDDPARPTPPKAAPGKPRVRRLKHT